MTVFVWLLLIQALSYVFSAPGIWRGFMWIVIFIYVDVKMLIWLFSFLWQ
jgi:hypothetical protein